MYEWVYTSDTHRPFLICSAGQLTARVVSIVYEDPNKISSGVRAININPSYLDLEIQDPLYWSWVNMLNEFLQEHKVTNYIFEIDPQHFCNQDPYYHKLFKLLSNVVIHPMQINNYYILDSDSYCFWYFTNEISESFIPYYLWPSATLLLNHFHAIYPSSYELSNHFNSISEKIMLELGSLDLIQMLESLESIRKSSPFLYWGCVTYWIKSFSSQFPYLKHLFPLSIKYISPQLQFDTKYYPFNASLYSFRLFFNDIYQLLIKVIRSFLVIRPI